MAIGRIPEPLAGIQEAILDAKGDLISATAADTPARLAVGSNNQTLIADSTQSTGLKWGASATSTLTAKGDLLTATAANTIARLGVGADGTTLVADSTQSTGLKWASASSGFVGCQAKITAAQTLNNATQTVINFAAEDFDTNGFHDNTTNNTRITIPSGYGGYYRIGAGVCLENMPTDNNFNIMIKKNGNNSAFWGGSYNSGPVLTMGYIGVVINLAAGDYIEVQAYQNSGSSVTTVYDPNNAFGYFNVQFLGA